LLVAQDLLALGLITAGLVAALRQPVIIFIIAYDLLSGMRISWQRGDTSIPVRGRCQSGRVKLIVSPHV
jgi:hypothetical protein